MPFRGLLTVVKMRSLYWSTRGMMQLVVIRIGPGNLANSDTCSSSSTD